MSANQELLPTALLPIPLICTEELSFLHYPKSRRDKNRPSISASPSENPPAPRDVATGGGSVSKRWEGGKLAYETEDQDPDFLFRPEKVGHPRDGSAHVCEFICIGGELKGRYRSCRYACARVSIWLSRTGKKISPLGRSRKGYLMRIRKNIEKKSQEMLYNGEPQYTLQRLSRNK